MRHSLMRPGKKTSGPVVRETEKIPPDCFLYPGGGGWHTYSEDIQ